MKLVLDTNVLVSAFVAHGACAELLEECLGEHELITSRYILNEFYRVLASKCRKPSRRPREATRLLAAHFHVVTPADVEPGACRDPSDLPVLGTALAARCDCIVTGDRDLLLLREFEGIAIVSPGEFWKRQAKFRRDSDE